MAVPTFIAKGADANPAFGNATPAVPAGVDGDVFLVVASLRSPIVTLTCSTPEWTSKIDLVIGTALRVAVWWARRSGGLDPATPAIARGAGGGYFVASVLQFRGCVGSGDPFDAGSAGALTATTAGSSITTTEIATQSDNCLVLHLFAASQSANVVPTFAFSGPLCATKAGADSTGGSTTRRIGHAIAYGTKAEAGATGAEAAATNIVLSGSAPGGSLLLALKADVVALSATSRADAPPIGTSSAGSTASTGSASSSATGALARGASAGEIASTGSALASIFAPAAGTSSSAGIRAEVLARGPDLRFNVEEVALDLEEESRSLVLAFFATAIDLNEEEGTMLPEFLIDVPEGDGAACKLTHRIDGVAIDLTGAVVTLRIQPRGGGAVLVEECAVDASGTFATAPVFGATSAALGAGVHSASIRVERDGQDPRTFPGKVRVLPVV